jgi:transcription antitermination factor NusG
MSFESSSTAVWYVIQAKWTRGLSHLGGWGDRLAPIADEVVAIIRNRMGEGGRVKIGLDAKPGEEVRIKTGHFKGLSLIKN